MENVRFRRKSMKLRFVSILLCVLAFARGSLPIAQAQVAAGETVRVSGATIAGFHVSGRSLLDANGNNFIMRGINVPHNWYPEQTSQFQHTKAKGANTVRVVLSSGQNWPKNSASDVANVINLCKTNKLVCVLEVHDTTGYGEVAGAITLAQAVTYWKEIKSVLMGQEAYVIINIGNEPYGNVNILSWINATKNAIAEMRNAGFQHTLMVDAPDWGQDWEFIMRDNATSIFNSDPNGNIVFSIHMYGVFDTSNKIQSYLLSFVNAGLPLVIGEFGHEHTDGNPDEDTIMSVAQTNGIGYLGWMWSGGSGDGSLDMVTDFDPTQETWWGNRIIHGANGIAETSQEASIYASTAPYTISGNAGVGEVTLSYLDGTPKTTTSSANGNYAFPVSNNWSGTVTPSHICFTFSPTSRSYSNVSANQTAQTYTPSFNSGSGCANINTQIGGANQGRYGLLPGASTRVSFANVNNGPVKIISDNGISLIAAERVIYKINGVNTSFTEVMALPDSQLDNIYWLPWYNNIDLDTQLRFGNVSGSTATVHVYIGGVEMTGSPFTLAAGASTRKSFAGINNGPVKIESNVNIVAAERVIYKVNGVNTSFTEMMGLPYSQLDTTYWLPWYNNVDLDTQLRFANVSASTATVHVYIGNSEMAGSPFTLTSGQSTRQSFAGINNGPVKIVSDVDIVAAERVIYKVNNVPTSFTEMMALPNSQLDSIYWLPWYNNVDLDTQLRFANVSGSTATVHVYIGGVDMTGSPFTLGIGESTRKSFAGVNNGPVQVVSDVDIVVSERVIYKVNGVNTSFSEMMALPNSQLDTTYWLPWYNNVDLDTQLRFGVP